MTSLPNDGPFDTDIKQVTASTRLLVDTSPFPLIRDSANATLSSSSWYEYMPQLVSPKAHGTTRLRGQGTTTKGKGVQRSLDWTRDASESEREGKWRPLFPSPMLSLPFIHRACVPIASITASFSAGHRPTANRTPSPIRSCGSEFRASSFIQSHISLL